MKFLCVYKPGKPEGAPPTQQAMAAMGKLIDEAMKAGWLLSTEGCLPSALGARVRLSDGKYTVTDGPFAETKEVIGGYWMLQVKSRAEAIEWASRAPMGDDEMIEVRQVFEAEDFGAALTPELRAQEEGLRSQTAKSEVR